MTTHHHSAYPSQHPGAIDAPMHAAVPVYDGAAQHQAFGPEANLDPYGAYGPGDGYAAGYVPAEPYAPTTFLGLNFRDQQFWKGAILGAAITLLFTSESVQKAIIKGTARLYGAVQGGVQEIKEKFEDVQAEMRQEPQKK